MILLLLSACVVDPAYTSGDPYTLAQHGAQLQTAANVQILSTEQAAVLEAHQLAMQSTGTAAAWQIGATQTIANGEVQQTEQAQSIAGTAHIVQLAATENAGRQTETVQAVLWVATSEAAGATATAIALQVEHETEMLRVRTAWVGIREAVYSLFVAATLIMAGIGMWTGIPWVASWLVEWQDRKRALYEMRQGGVAWIDGKPVLLSDVSYYRPRHNLNEQPGDIEPVTLSANRITAESKLVKRSQTEQELAWLLSRCDPDSNQVAGHRAAGMSAKAWSRVTDAAQAAGILRKEGGVGTFILDGTCKDVL